MSCHVVNSGAYEISSSGEHKHELAYTMLCTPLLLFVFFVTAATASVPIPGFHRGRSARGSGDSTLIVDPDCGFLGDAVVARRLALGLDMFSKPLWWAKTTSARLRGLPQP